MHADDIGKTAIITPFGSFEFLRQTFQRFIDDVMRGLDFVFYYIDDLLISSSSPAEHLSHLRTVFQRLDAAGITIHPSNVFSGARIGLPRLSLGYL